MDVSQQNSHSTEQPNEQTPAAAAAAASTTTTADSSAVADISVFGIDLGTQKCVIAACRSAWKRMPTIVNNDLSNAATPAVVAFRDNERLVGEAAASLFTMQPTQTVTQLPRLLGRSVGEIARDVCVFAPVEALNEAQGDASPAVVTLGGERWRPEEIAATMLRRLASFADNTVTQALPEKARAPIKGVVLTSPVSANARSRGAMRAAAMIAGLEVLDVISDLDAAAVLYGVTRVRSDTESTRVLFVDVGHGHAQAEVVEYTQNKLKVLAQAGTEEAGSAAFDRLVTKLLFDEWKAKKGTDLTQNARSRARFERQAEKTKQMLSTVPEAHAELSNADDELRVAIKRTTFEELCAPLLCKITDLIALALKEAGVEDASQLESVEVLGGGARMPAVAAAIQQAVGARELGHHLDGAAAVADGAALWAAVRCSPPFDHTYSAEFLTRAGDERITLSDAELLQCRTREQEMAEKDAQNEKRLMAANALESVCYAMRDNIRSLSSLPQAEKTKLNTLLDAALSWHSESASSAPTNELTQKHDSLLRELKESSSVFANFLKQQEDKKKQELLEMREAQQKAAEEAATSDKKKRDRPLSNAERIAAAQKAKQQGNALFKENVDYTMAAAKWIEALGMLEGAWDVSDTQRAEFDEIKLTCYLNLAMAYLKLQIPHKAQHNAAKALELQPKNVKALFRRGQAYQMQKKWDEALADFSEVLNVEPDNTAATAEQTRVQKIIDARVVKEKQMYGKMFSS